MPITKTAGRSRRGVDRGHANIHGIINNAWVDRATLKRVNCVDDDSVGDSRPRRCAWRRSLPGTTTPLGASPRRLLATTVGDELKLTRGGRSKVIGISSKDRSAILLAGKLADAAYWMDKGRHRDVDALHEGAAGLGAGVQRAGRVDSFFGKTWDRLLPATAYEGLQGPDEGPRGSEFGMGRTFPSGSTAARTRSRRHITTRSRIRHSRAKCSPTSRESWWNRKTSDGAVSRTCFA